MTSDKFKLIADPGTLLTERQSEVLLWTALGKTTEEVALILGVAFSTAKSHIDMVAAKLHAHNKAHMIAKAFALGHLRTATQVMRNTALALAIFSLTSAVAPFADPPERPHRLSRNQTQTRARRRETLDPSEWRFDYV